MPGALVDPHHGFLGRPCREAEDLARLGVEPRTLEVDALVLLDREVAVVRLAKLLAGDADEPAVHVHELGHTRYLDRGRTSAGRGQTVAAPPAPVIGRSTDGPARRRPTLGHDMPTTTSLVSPILLGRDDLLELAERRLEAAQRGSGHLLFLAGEAGVGKTRLLGSIERRAVALGFRSVRGGTYPGDLEVAGAVFLDLGRALGRAPGCDGLGDRLAGLLSRFDAGGGTGDAHRRRRLLTLDLASTLAEAAAVPTVISLEDLHQSDDLTLETLAVLARRLPELPLLVVATYRSDELYPRVPMREWRARLLGHRLAEEARLRRLSVDETARMTSLLLGGGTAVAHDVAAAVHARTDGIPLHVEELIGLASAAGADEANSPPSPIGGTDVPDTLEAAILGRVERRSGRAQRVARIGAVIGRSFEFDLLASVLGEDSERLARPLEELATHFFLAESPASGRYGFRHALICDAIYGQIPSPERRRLHGRIADVAAARGDFSDAFLSSHYERAGRRAEAFAAALGAARAAEVISARREAFDLYARAVRNAPFDLPAAELGALLEAYGAAAAAADDNATAVDALERARASYVLAGQPAAAARVVAPIVASQHLLGAPLEERAARLRAAVAELDHDGPDAAAEPEQAVARARLTAGLAGAYMLDRRLDDAIAHGERARTLAWAAADGAAERHASVSLGSSLVFAGRMDEGWRLLDENVEAAKEAALEAEAARAYRMVGSSASVLVEYVRAERQLREGIAYAERVELWNDRHYMAAHLGHVLWATGRWTEAASVAEHALADGRGGLTTRITALHVLGFLAMGRGSWAAAEAALHEALAFGERMRELQRSSPAMWGLAETALLQGDAASAADWSRRGLAASRAVEDGAYLFPFLVTGTRALVALGDPAAAASWAAEVSAALRRRDIPGTRPALVHAEGLVALAQGATGRARDALVVAKRGWEERGRAWEHAWARLDLATVHLRTNRPADATAELERLLGDARALGAAPLIERAEPLLRAARARRPGTEPWDPLTAREWDVARRVANGATNAEIAGELGVSPRTVASHVEHILAKLGAGRRTEIAAWAARVPVYGGPAGPRTAGSGTRAEQRAGPSDP